MCSLSLHLCFLTSSLYFGALLFFCLLHAEDLKVLVSFICSACFTNEADHWENLLSLVAARRLQRFQQSQMLWLAVDSRWQCSCSVIKLWKSFYSPLRKLHWQHFFSLFQYVGVNALALWLLFSLHFFIPWASAKNHHFTPQTATLDSSSVVSF